MNKKYFHSCISVIKTIDSYIRSIEEKDIDDYEDFYPFIDYNDISLYKDVDRDTIINYTVGIILKSNLDLKNIKNIQSISMVSYILTIKYITDCCVYKPYTFFIDFFTQVINNGEMKEDDKKSFIKKAMRLETRILQNINYFSKNEN